MRRCTPTSASRRFCSCPRTRTSVSDPDLLPGSNVLTERSSRAITGDEMNYIMRSGRALLYPVYKSTYERGDVLRDAHPSTTAVFRDHMIMWSKDVGRSIDYLESRPDIARDRLGFLGLSWGSAMAPLFLALEPRIKAAVLLGPGFFMQAALPEADPVNFAPRVRMPVLMLNGRFDFLFPTGSRRNRCSSCSGHPTTINAESFTTPLIPFRVRSSSARRLRGLTGISVRPAE